MSVNAPDRTASRRRRRSLRAALVVANVAILGVFIHQLLALPSISTNSVTLGVPDGAIPDGTTVFDDHVAGVANLDPALLEAVRRAATDAGRDGITFYVNSGWRTAAYQQSLLREAVAKYGSEKEAARWVATPEKSPHVAGQAVDIGRTDATRWLARNGSRYGLCQIYDNEPWHYEFRPEAISGGCAPRYPDPTHDPRMQG
ncbi:M15 family metallopeptidase [Kribbella sp. NPDC048915]|uniref:M15 family metallopeptidase n=1 Tax=Kribbella sp. NPDC048915 TaxID=3155148 RepID=UPI0033D0C283